jgi:hypothetical protein
MQQPRELVFSSVFAYAQAVCLANGFNAAERRLIPFSSLSNATMPILMQYEIEEDRYQKKNNTPPWYGLKIRYSITCLMLLRMHSSQIRKHPAICSNTP